MPSLPRPRRGAKQRFVNHLHARSRKALGPTLELLEDRLVPSGTYYISPLGDDLADGLSPETAWQTIGRVNRHGHEAGDSYLFQGGAQFNGSLGIFYGDPDNPITIGSYGTDRATIYSGTERGLWACSAGGMQVEDLVFMGESSDTNQVNGIEFCNYGVYSGQAAHFHVRNVDVSGYGIAGITVMSDPIYGITDVSITHSRVHHNANGILMGNMESPARLIWDLYIGYVEADNNESNTAGMAGIGIALNNVGNGIVERSLLHHNGHTSRSPGKAGLIVMDSSDLLVQYNESYYNLDPTGWDGQGFVFVGVTGSVMQYNYSHDNGNGGFQLTTDYPYQQPSINNTIRFNVSENDASGIVVFFEVRDADIHNNTVFTRTVGGAERYPLVVGFWTGSNVHFWNNIFQSDGGAPAVMVEESSLLTGRNLVFQNNIYYAGYHPELETYIIWGAEGYYNLPSFRTGTSQERLGIHDLGSTYEPGLVSPGGGGTVGNPDLLFTLRAYELRDDSPFRDLALDLPEYFGVYPGDEDFFGTFFGGFAMSIGAYQAPETLGPGAPAPSAPPPQPRLLIGVFGGDAQALSSLIIPGPVTPHAGFPFARQRLLLGLGYDPHAQPSHIVAAARAAIQAPPPVTSVRTTVTTIPPVAGGLQEALQVGVKSELGGWGDWAVHA